VNKSSMVFVGTDQRFFEAHCYEFDNGLNGGSAEVEGAKSIFTIPGRALK
jgi:hypothetical protein